MNEIEELRKELDDLRHIVEKNELRINSNDGDIKQIWMFVKIYVVDTVKKIGSFRFTKKQLTTFFVSFMLWLTSIILRFFNVI